MHHVLSRRHCLAARGDLDDLASRPCCLLEVMSLPQSFCCTEGEHGRKNVTALPEMVDVSYVLTPKLWCTNVMAGFYG